MEEQTQSHRIQTVFTWTTMGVATLALVQAWLAGRGWFVESRFISVHGWVGIVTFLMAGALFALATMCWRQGMVGRMAPGLSGVILLLLIAQLGLGYGGRRSNLAASLHVPNGALIFGICVALGVLTWSWRRDRDLEREAG